MFIVWGDFTRLLFSFLRVTSPVEERFFYSVLDKLLSVWYIYYHIEILRRRSIMTFGEFVKTRRLEAGLSLREFCKLVELDPSNWSKIERGLFPATANRETLETIAKIVKLKKGSDLWSTFFDLAYISQQRIPDDVYKDEDVVSALPVFFRTVRGEKPSEEELDKLIALLKRR